MNDTSTNVVSFTDAKVASSRRAIIDSLQNRGANWVSEPFLMTVIMDDMPAGVTAKELLDEMVQEGKLEKSYHTATDKMNRTLQLPLYRLCTR